MRIGLTVPFEGVALEALPALVRRAEAAGYESLWSAEATGYDAVTPLAIAAAVTRHVRLVTGVLGVYTRAATTVAQTAAALADASGGRFALGLGVSSNVVVQQWNGIPFERPLARMRETIEELRTVLAGGRSGRGFRLQTPPAHPVPILVAALRPGMLRLASEHADGAFTNFLPLAGVSRVVRAFAAPGKELACRFFSIPGPEEDALPVARRIFAAYVTVPVYAEYFRWLGYADGIRPVIDAWRAGERARAVGLVPDAIVRDTFLLGPVEAQRERLARFEAAGISTAVLATLWPPERQAAAIDAFAPG